MCEHRTFGPGRGRTYLIMVSRTPTGTKTALASVMLGTSFAKFKASVARFNGEVVLSCSFGRWGSAGIVKLGGAVGLDLGTDDGERSEL